MTVIRNGKEEIIASQFIIPGDLVVVRHDGDVPCDLVLLQSSSGDNKCHVTTANLDGETNLKTILAPHNYDLSAGQGGCIVCEPATADLYSFNGRLEPKSGEAALPLTIDNLLLRGVRLQGTDRAVGSAIYTGMQTKLQLNSRYTGNKSASSEKYINKFMVALIVGMVVVVAVLYLIERWVGNSGKSLSTITKSLFFTAATRRPRWCRPCPTWDPPPTSTRPGRSSRTSSPSCCSSTTWCPSPPT